MKPLDPIALPLSGTQLIEASAGTGKTYTITTIVLRLLLETELSVDQIVVVTFTRAATSELRDRIRLRISAAAAAFEGAASGKPPESGKDPVLDSLLRTQHAERALGRLRRALRDLDRAAIFTIHGFAQRTLQQHAFESGARFDVELVGEQRLLVTEVAHDFWAKEIATLPEECWRVLRVCNVTLRSVTALAHVAAAWRDLPLEPDLSSIGSADLEGSLGDLSVAWARVVDEYRRGGDAAFALLAKPGFHKTYYSSDRLAAYRRTLDALSSLRPQLFKELPGAFKCLAAGSIKVNKGYTAPEHPLFDAIAALGEASDRCRAEAGRFVDALRCRLVKFARERVALEHERAGTQSFDDLLHGMRKALCESGKSEPGKADKVRGTALARQVRERYPVALIDEFQDTDPVQYEIFRRIYGVQRRGERTALFLIGDPKQAIYAFRGADIDAYLAAARDAAENVWTLTTNYRSDPGFVSALNCVFERLEEPFLHPGIAYTAVQAAPGRSDGSSRAGAAMPPLEIAYLTREEAGRTHSRNWEGTEEWQRLASEEIARLLASKVTLPGATGPVPLEPRHVAVLTRTNRQAQDIQEHLRLLGIPSVLQGDRTVFEAPEAGELALLLRALAEPSSGGAVRTALATRFLGLDASAIARVAEDEEEWEAWTLRFREWNGIWAERGLMQCLERVLREQDVVPRTLRELDGERRMTNLRHLAELLHQAECEGHLGIPGLLQWFDEARLDPTRHGMAPEAQQLRLESDADAVVLTTMHKSKGLEYPVVVLPFLGARSAPFSGEQENLRYHNPQRGGRLELDVRSKEHKSAQLEIATREHQAEAMRLAYVALTRARHHCLVLWGGVSGSFSSLAYLLHQPAADLGGLAVDVATRLKELDDAARYAEVEALALRSDGVIRVRQARLGLAPVYQREETKTSRPLTARQLRRRVPSGLRTSSFSAMTRSQEANSLSIQAREGRDVDEGTLIEPLTALSEFAAGEGTGDTSPVTLAEFPRGPKPGDLLHAILEKLPIQGLRTPSGDPASLHSIVEGELRRRGFSASHLPTVLQALEEILATPFAEGPETTLGAVFGGQCVAEMEFTLPVALGDEVGGHELDDPAPEGRATSATNDSPKARRSPVLTARGLAEAFSSEVEAPWSQDYPRRLARLGFGGWSGFLRGFIDLVFERNGRYFVVDYKSNHLGPTRDHYAAASMEPAMAEHHYYLQYVLYSVALHRYLRRRIVHYSIEQHFGGVYYLFLRGMHPSTGARRGVFFHRPGSTLIERVSALLGDQEASPCD